MNAERLLQLYHRVSEAPDAIPRLRRFILDLAVRGKLVEQDPNDEPASVLRARIIHERDRLTKAGEFREPRNALEIDRDRLPFSVPTRWSWVRLIDIARVNYGFAFASSRFNNEKRGMPLLRIRDISKSDTEAYYDGDFDSAYVVSNGDYVVGMDGDFNVRCWKGNQALLNQRVMRICDWKCQVCPEFIKLPLQYVLDFLHSYTSQTTVKHLSAKQVNGIEIPLPPLAEQHRIVAKVDELMSLCDSLEAERDKREATRDRLATASLSRLTAPDVEEKQFRAHADFAIKVLPELTTRPDQIKVLRQTILDLAVRGKLVEQDPNDELAAELLQKIKIEKSRLVQAGRFKTLEAEFSRKPDDFPFSLPKVWTWTYLDDLAAVARGGSPRPIKSYLTTEQNGIPWIKIGDSVRGSIYIDSTKEKIRPEGLSKSRLVVPGDLLLSNSMSFGYPYITNVEGCIHDGWLVIRTPETLINKLFLHAVFCSSHAKESFLRAASGAVVQNLNADKARSLSIPLPPLAEQHRIVAKVDELMAHCDQLELALHSGRGTRRHLLEALLVGALEPLAMEAA